MQTFLPYPDFARSAAALDNKRLGKQRVEAKQIYLALTNPDYGWQHHPAVKMWRGHEGALASYGFECCTEWLARGFNDSLRDWFLHCPGDIGRPVWVGDPAFHLSHQSNLVRKDPAHYGPQFPGVSPDLPYVWPTPITTDLMDNESKTPRTDATHNSAGDYYTLLDLARTLETELARVTAERDAKAEECREASQHAAKAMKDRDALRARVAELEAAMREARSYVASHTNNAAMHLHARIRSALARAESATPATRWEGVDELTRAVAEFATPAKHPDTERLEFAFAHDMIVNRGMQSFVRTRGQFDAQRSEWVDAARKQGGLTP